MSGKSYSIENEILKITTAPLGAELTSIYHKKLELEYMWKGASERWERQNPVLFPIIATLPNNTYTHEGKDYKMTIHGFAMDSEFSLKNQTENSISFELVSNEDTLRQFPFEFSLLVTYKLEGNTLHTAYLVQNTSDNELKFCIGGHPTFACPLEKEAAFNDYYLRFEEKETIERLLMDGALMSGKSEPLLTEEDTIHLDKQLFKENAIITEGYTSKSLTYGSDKYAHGVHLHFNEHPHMGIFSFAESITDEYICIEPWYGIPGHVDEKALADKPGHITLQQNESFKSNYSIEVF